MCRSRRPAAVIELGSQYCLRNNQRSVPLSHAADINAAIRSAMLQFIQAKLNAQRNKRSELFFKMLAQKQIFAKEY